MKNQCNDLYIKKLMGGHCDSSESPAERLMRGTKHRFAGGITNSTPDLSLPSQMAGGPMMTEQDDSGLQRYMGGSATEPLRRAMGGVGKIRKGIIKQKGFVR